MPAGVANYTTTGTQPVSIDDLVVFEDIVLCEEILEEKTVGGIILPDVQDAQKMRWARVLKQGPGRRDADGELIAMWIQPGDIVMFGKYQSGGEPISVNGKTLLMFRVNDFAARRKRSEEYAPELRVA